MWKISMGKKNEVEEGESLTHRNAPLVGDPNLIQWFRAASAETCAATTSSRTSVVSQRAPNPIDGLSVVCQEKLTCYNNN
jgi:hypothetical protein